MDDKTRKALGVCATWLSDDGAGEYSPTTYKEWARLIHEVIDNAPPPEPTDAYALYLQAYTARLSGGCVPYPDVTGRTTVEMLAIAKGVEDGVAECEGHGGRYDVLYTIETENEFAPLPAVEEA